MRNTWRDLSPPNQGAILHATAAVLLDEEGRSVPDWEIVGPQIAAEIDRQSGELLADASADFDAFETAAGASHAHRTGDQIPLCAVLPGLWPYTCSWLSRGLSSYRWRQLIPGLA